MNLQSTTDVSLVVSFRLEKAGFIHAFSSRVGNLNLSYSHGPHSAVDENRRRFLSGIGTPGWRVITLQQTHSDTRVVIDEQTLRSLPDDPQFETPGDALLTDRPNILIGVKTADCVPVLIGDPETKAMAAVHAGWRGTLARITEKTVSDMAQIFGAHPENLVAAIGPSACMRCYEVDTDVSQKFQKEFPKAIGIVKQEKNQKPHLDVSLANAHQLQRAGLRSDKIATSEFCTMHDNDLFFSHRRDTQSGQPSGRLLAVIGRRKE